MNMLLVSLLLMLAACGGSPSSAPAQHPKDDSGQARVDDTVPSWLPQSCIAYHKAVVQAISCQAVEQAKRDEIQKSYGDTSASWKTEQNADPARIDAIGASCTAATASVRADIGESCV
jgi:hypothetical protein